MLLAKDDPILKVRDANGREGYLRAPAAGTLRYEATAIQGAERPVSATVASLTPAETQAPRQDTSGAAGVPEPQAPQPQGSQPQNGFTEAMPLRWRGLFGWGVLFAFCIGFLSIDLELAIIIEMIAVILFLAFLTMFLLSILGFNARGGSFRAGLVRFLALVCVPGFATMLAAYEATSTTPDGLLPSLIAHYAVDDQGGWKLPWGEAELAQAQADTPAEAQAPPRMETPPDRVEQAPAQPRCEAAFQSGNFSVEVKVDIDSSMDPNFTSRILSRTMDRNDETSDPPPTPRENLLRSRINIISGPYDFEFDYLKRSLNPASASLTFWARPGEAPWFTPSSDDDDVRDYTVQVFIDGLKYGERRHFPSPSDSIPNLYTIGFLEGTEMGTRSRIEDMQSPTDERATLFLSAFTIGFNLEIIVETRMWDQGDEANQTRDTVPLDGAVRAFMEADRQMRQLQTDAVARHCIPAHI